MTSTAANAVVVAPEEPTPDTDDEKAFGFWLYLLSDAIIFSLLIATYAVMSGNTAGGPDAKSVFSLSRAFSGTMALLVSSITFGLASLALRARRVDALLSWLFVTFLFGLAFVGMEIAEFREMVAHGAGPDRSGFLSSFFTLVGTHGIHVTVGLLWIVIMMVQVLVKGLTGPVESRLVRLGLFWHFLDIVWVAIFSLVYLPGAL